MENIFLKMNRIII